MKHSASLNIAFVTLMLLLQPSGDIHAKGKKPKSCIDKYTDCVQRCANRAMEKEGTKEISNKKVQASIQACDKRTCTPQLRNCELGPKDQKFSVPEGQLPRFEQDGGGNPRKTPTGNMPDITGDGGIQ